MKNFLDRTRADFLSRISRNKGKEEPCVLAGPLQGVKKKPITWYKTSVNNWRFLMTTNEPWKNEPNYKPGLMPGLDYVAQ